MEREFGVVLPDYLHTDYPYDVPPGRLAYARQVLSAFRTWRRCSDPACKRSHACVGGDGPPCYRADRHSLQQVLLVCHLVDLGAYQLPDFVPILLGAGNPYGLNPNDHEGAPTPPRKPHHRRR